MKALSIQQPWAALIVYGIPILKDAPVGDGMTRLEDSRLRAYKDIGVTFATLTFVGPNADAIGEQMAAFIRDVAPKV